jgi:diguanylate cyclase (GGDEF)-like protein
MTRVEKSKGYGPPMKGWHPRWPMLRDAERKRIASHIMTNLSGLPNRLALMERLRAAIESAHRQQTKLALLFIDLDSFKVVNDGYGHSILDKLLAVAAKRIATCSREEDIACRYGGDEFIVVLSDIHDAAISTGIAETI